MNGRLFKNFSLLSAGLWVGAALLLGSAITYLVEQKMLEQATLASLDYFKDLARFITTKEEFVALRTGEEYEAFDRLVRGNFLTAHVVTIKIYDRSGTDSGEEPEFLKVLAVGCGLLMGAGAMSPVRVAGQTAPPTGDEEFATLLVTLVLRTRAASAKQYETDRLPGWDRLFKYALAKNEVLPAAVADQVFRAVPDLTAGRAWVKMVVDNPRNPNNKGDETAVQLLAELRRGAGPVERRTTAAYYYAEPIRAKPWCLRCHGEPEGQPDPLFPKHSKEGWKDGAIVGAVVARVAPGR